MKRDDRLMDWGESMYGGYYATLIIDGKVVGLHAETQRELRNQITSYGVCSKLEKNKRRDN